MRWVAPTERDDANHALEKRLWDAADQFRANSGLKAERRREYFEWAKHVVDGLRGVNARLEGLFDAAYARRP
jgi:hypothetical protein